MAVSEYKERKALVVQWDKGSYEGPVRLILNSTNDISETVFNSNTGFGAITYPLDYSGGTKVEVFDNDGNVLDEGEVNV